MQNYMLCLSYDGSRYQGWQRQGNAPNTIQARLEELLSRALSQPVELAGSGRTDAGVHARRQVCSFRARTDHNPEELLHELRRYAPEDIALLSLSPAPERFHARLSCTGKTYVYRLWTGAAPCVFQRRYLLPHPSPLDEESMKEAGRLLCGRHDFTSFCANRNMKKSAVRTLYAVDLHRQGDELRLCYTGDGFLYNMARILTGTLLEVGEGKRRAEDMPAILEGRSRTLAGPAAPAQGLFLWDVYYKGEEKAEILSPFGQDYP